VILISVRGSVNPRAIVRLEGLIKEKIAIISSGIEPGTAGLEAKCLNQICYRDKLTNITPIHIFE
jgi:hypothetical protein